MRVVIQSGIRKDQVQDLPMAAATSMVADGRARWEFPDQLPSENAAAPESAPVPVKKKGRHAHN